MKAYDLIVFDWDGTLMDSEVRIVTCMQRAARDTDNPVPAVAEVREIIGLSMPRAVQQLFPGVDDAGVEAVIDAYRTHWLGGQIPESALFPGALALLQGLAADNYLLAVATGKSRRGLDKVLTESGLADLFHATRCADEAFSKPHPQMLQDILVDLDTAPQRALVVGDTEYDIQMAVNAGVEALGVSHGAHTEQRLIDNGALTVLKELAELPVWLSDKQITRS
jgi:phosphoglycolate phosphatase